MWQMLWVGSLFSISSHFFSSSLSFLPSTNLHHRVRGGSGLGTELRLGSLTEGMLPSSVSWRGLHSPFPHSQPAKQAGRQAEFSSCVFLHVSATDLWSVEGSPHRGMDTAPLLTRPELLIGNLCQQLSKNAEGQPQTRQEGGHRK